MKTNPIPRPLVRTGILLSLLSMIGGAITTNEALRLAGRILAKAPLLYTRAGLAGLSVLASLVVLAACVHASKRDDRSVLQRLMFACGVGLAVELLYQGFDLFYYGSMLGSSQVAPVILFQMGLFAAWGTLKCVVLISLMKKCADSSAPTPGA